jgi:hypothetical protein
MDDPDPLPDQATGTYFDLCDALGTLNCNTETENQLQAFSQQDLEDGCVESPRDCDDDNACTTDSCDPAIGCVNDPIVCDDGDACTTDSCDPETGCATTPVNCDDGDACTIDSCDPETGCGTTPVVCDDANACTTDSCDPETGCVFGTPTDCDDDDVCTEDSCNPETGACVNTPITEDPPLECLGDEICRTPGFWATHGGTEKNRSQNITDEVLGAGLEVCGTIIDNTDTGNSTSAIEAMCVSPKGDSSLQLVRQLTAAALNCALGDCTTEHADLLADCNDTCADGSGDLSVNECIDQLDCFNNGGTWDGDSCVTGAGSCEFSGDPCDDENACEGVDEACIPAETCHDRELCPDFFDDGEINDSDFCFEPPGPAGSQGACNVAKKNDVFVP